MTRITSIALICLVLSGCMLRTHKADVIQGNVIYDNQVKQLHTGMTENDVRNLMGTPVLINVFTPGRTTYLYTYQEGYGTMRKKSVTLLFDRGRVSSIDVTS